MKILGIESSAITASAAVVCDGEILSDAFLNAGLTHSQTLAPLVKEALSKSSSQLFDMDLIAVTNGPGSFTGVRIGVSLAKGLATPMEIPCLGVSSLEAAAYRFHQQEKIIWSAMDARRGQIYTAAFRFAHGHWERLLPDSALSIEEAAKNISQFGSDFLLCGDGAFVTASALEKMEMAKSFHWIIPEGDNVYQRATDAALLAEYQILHTDQTPLSPKFLNPTYLRPPQAERALRKKS